MNAQLKALIALDNQLVNTAKDIKVLSNLSWPKELRDRFLDAWHSGNPILPSFSYKPVDFREPCKELAQIMSKVDKSHPLGNYIFNTAKSYATAAAMLEGRGTPQFTALAIELYGSPGDLIAKGSPSILNAADTFIQATADFEPSCYVNDTEYCILPETVAFEVKKQVTEFFTNHKIEVVIDPELTAKAAAGAKRIRIRGYTSFAPFDIPQLINHECFVHSLTALNGREQPHFKSLGLGAPRTTRTQEGLAVFSELISSCMDLARLRRIALRVKAIDHALSGADFLEVFRFFLDSGQNEFESLQSAFRIFRGGDVNGGIVFTKDIIYLAGLLDVHTFLRKCIQEGKLNYLHYLVSGRLKLSDVINLEECFEEGILATPLYEPKWLVNRPCLTAFLIFSNYLNQIRLADISLSGYALAPC